MANTISIGRCTITIIPDGVTDFDITTIQTNRFPLASVTGDFTAGETVVQASSSAMGTVARWDKVQKSLYLYSMTGTFDNTNAITGGTSGAIGTPIEVAYAFPGGIRLSKADFASSQIGDTLTIRERSAHGPVIFARHRDASNSGFHRPVGGRSFRVNPYILAAEQDWGTPANVQIVLEYD